MKIFLVTIVIIVVFFIWISIEDRKRKKRESEYIDSLSKDSSFIFICVDTKIERFSWDSEEQLDPILKKGKEFAFGPGCIILIDDMVALFSKELRPDGVKEMGWSIEIDEIKIEDNSLIFKAGLPDSTDSEFKCINLLDKIDKNFISRNLGV